MRIAELNIIIGTNGTGKTTLLRSILQDSKQKVLIVTPDDIDLSLYQSREVVPSETKLSEFEELQQKDKIEFIQKTIQQVGTKAEAARRLGIKPTHLQYLLGRNL